MSSYDVLVIDMFHYDEESESFVRGFPSLEIATEYARRRTRDSLEELRTDSTSPEDLRKMWYSFGEDCCVLGGEYKGASEIDFFIAHPATSGERDWITLGKLAKN